MEEWKSVFKRRSLYIHTAAPTAAHHYTVHPPHHHPFFRGKKTEKETINPTLLFPHPLLRGPDTFAPIGGRYREDGCPFYFPVPHPVTRRYPPQIYSAHAGTTMPPSTSFKKRWYVPPIGVGFRSPWCTCMGWSVECLVMWCVDVEGGKGRRGVRFLVGGGLGHVGMRMYVAWGLRSMRSMLACVA